MRYNAARAFLKMIGREPAVLGADEVLKVQPRGACQEAQSMFLRRNDFCGRLAIGRADSGRDVWRGDPPQ